MKYTEAVTSVGNRLDRARPGWLDRMPIGHGQLEMYNRGRCVLGFAYGDYYVGKAMLVSRTGQLGRFERWCLNPMPWRVRLVTRLWREEIRRRRRSVQEQTAERWTEAEKILT